MLSSPGRIEAWLNGTRLQSGQLGQLPVDMRIAWQCHQSLGAVERPDTAQYDVLSSRHLIGGERAANSVGRLGFVEPCS